MKRGRNILFILASAICLSSIQCKNDSGEGEGVVSDQISSKIAIPVDENHVVDTANVAKLQFEFTTIDFDTITSGTIISRRFPFTNVGKRPLLISDIKSSCGCTTVYMPEKTIPPGGSSHIEVEFDSTDRKGQQNKTINIIGNTFPTRTLLYLQGFVN